VWFWCGFARGKKQVGLRIVASIDFQLQSKNMIVDSDIKHLTECHLWKTRQK